MDKQNIAKMDKASQYRESHTTVAWKGGPIPLL